MREAGPGMKDATDPGGLLREVAAAVALVEGEAGVRDLIDVIATLEPVSVRKISRTAELPVPIVAAVCGELRKRGVVARDRPVRLTGLGRDLYGHCNTHPSFSALCPSCEGRGLVLDGELAGVAADLTNIAEGAPMARMEIDQSHCTVPTKLRRVLLMHEAGALIGRRILLLGDDDLMSITIDRLAGQLGFDESIREVTVVDVDPGVLSYCRSSLKKASFPVRLLHHDLREPLPPDLTGKFDTVFTDPPYTPEGADLFLSRAAVALSSRTRGNVFFCFGMKPPHESLRIQTAIAGMGLLTRRLVSNFNEYAGAGTLGGASNIYHLVSTNQTRPSIGGFYSGHLYTGDKLRTRRYRCASCGAIEAVGHGNQWPTVGDLKAHGCPRCGASVFRPLPRSNGQRSRDLMPRKADTKAASIAGSISKSQPK